jgi:uncharacterized sporulation protein YeaH/YhbH (DUF444 family)
MWNIYAFHCSDGDNWPSDNKKSANLSLKLADMCQLYAYVQTTHGIGDYWSSNNTIVADYSLINHKKFKIAHLEKKVDVWQEFKRILGGSSGLEN